MTDNPPTTPLAGVINNISDQLYESMIQQDYDDIASLISSEKNRNEIEDKIILGADALMGHCMHAKDDNAGCRLVTCNANKRAVGVLA